MEKRHIHTTTNLKFTSIFLFYLSLICYRILICNNIMLFLFIFAFVNVKQVVRKAYEKIVSNTDAFRNHDLQESAMSVLPITKNLIVGAFSWFQVCTLIFLIFILLSKLLDSSHFHDNVIHFTDD